MHNYLVVLVGLMGIQAFSANADSNAGSNLAQPALTPLSAQFETIECALPCNKPSNTTWWMWRTASQVELKKANSSNSELWTWDNGNVNYQFLMRDEKKLIEYSQIDLKMLDIAADHAKWQAVTSLVSQKDLGSMKKNPPKRAIQRLSTDQI